LVAAVGLCVPYFSLTNESFADAYDLFAVNFVNVLLGYVYYPEVGGVLPSNVDLSTKMAGSVGTVIGQIGFGILNDIYGRKKVIRKQIKLLTSRCMAWN
jgi:MFS transporter, PHS family, inorganic phosphate transporter